MSLALFTNPFSVKKTFSLFSDPSSVKKTFSLFLFFLLVSCKTLPARNNSPYLSLKLSVTQDQKEVFYAYGYLKKEEALRLDIRKAFLGRVASLFLRDKEIVLQFPMERAYYKGSFNSQIFFPQFDSFPKEWVFHLLRNEVSKDWTCKKSALLFCRAKGIALTWIKNKGLIHEVDLKDSKNRSLILKMEKLSYKPLKDKAFRFEPKGQVRLSISDLKKKF